MQPLFAALCLAVCVSVCSRANLSAADPTPQNSALGPNRFSTYPQPQAFRRGVNWPAGQAMPVFATPAATLDTIEVQQLSIDEQLTFSALQGVVNRRQPRIYLLDARSDEGRDTWAQTSTIGFKSLNSYDRLTKYQLLAKYADEIHGVVLYSTQRSDHYRNLASTVAGLHNALPVTAEVLEQINRTLPRSENRQPDNADGSLKVLMDLTQLPFETPAAIYSHMLEHYWPRCEKRLVLSAKPDTQGGDHHHTRDLAAAFGGAVVWLDTRQPEERELMRRFYRDMPAGNAFVLGWHATERSGISLASEYAIATLPSDHFLNSSVYAGCDHIITAPGVPRKPALENKAYVTVFISDGDNIQYNQRAMRRIWDESANSRGKLPLNWTISPSLVDLAPGILNYYYATATSNDCFATGPSGIGYLMPCNTLEEPGAPLGEYLSEPNRMMAYARTTETYLQRSGLRVVTIWDDASPMQRKAYELGCRNLYGATVQNFKDVPSVASSVCNDRVYFNKLEIPYAGTLEHIERSARECLETWDKKSPIFLAYQANIWGELRPDKLIEFKQHLDEQYPGMIEWVRADHYFNLFNEAQGLPFNLTLSPTIHLTASSSTAQLDAVTDGTDATHWEATEAGHQWIQFDLGSPHSLTRLVLRHLRSEKAGAQSVREIGIEVSTDGNAWSKLGTCETSSTVSDHDLEPVIARYVKLNFATPSPSARASLAGAEIYGRVVAQ